MKSTGQMFHLLLLNGFHLERKIPKQLLGKYRGIIEHTGKDTPSDSAYFILNKTCEIDTLLDTYLC